MASQLTFLADGAELTIEAPRRQSFAGFVFHTPPGYTITQVLKDGEKWSQFDERSITVPAADAKLRIRWQNDKDLGLSYVKTVKAYLESLKNQPVEEEQLVARNRANLAFRKPVECPTIPPSDLLPVGNVVDGDPETYVLASNPLPVTVDLGQKYDLHRIRVLLYSAQWYMGGPIEHIYSISLSSDKKDWKEVVPSRKRRAEGEAWFEHALPGGTRALRSRDGGIRFTL
jgi:hypothetical protein